jgi:hypothetical protein
MLERTDGITNEVLELITFVLAFPTVYGENSAVDAWCIGRPCHVPRTVNCIVTVHCVAVLLNTAAELRQSTANTVAVHSCGMCTVQLATCAVRFVESCEKRHETDFEIALSPLLRNDVKNLYVVVYIVLYT